MRERALIHAAGPENRRQAVKYVFCSMKITFSVHDMRIPLAAGRAEPVY